MNIYRRIGPFAIIEILIAAAILILLFIALDLPALAGLNPATCAVTNLRDTASIAYLNDVSYFENTTIMATNCVAYSGATTDTDPEDLTLCTVEWTLGNTTTNVTYSGTVVNATAGTWYAEGTVPAYSNMTEFYCETKITDTNSSVEYIYEWHKMKIKQALNP